MFLEEHVNSDTLIAIIICTFFLTLALIIATAILLAPGIEMRAKLKKEEHDDFRRVAIEEHRKSIKVMVDASRRLGER